MDVAALRQLDLVREHRYQKRRIGAALASQSLPAEGPGKSGDGADASCRHLIDCLESCSGINPQLVCFLFPVFRGKELSYLQAASGDLHMGQSGSLFVPGNLVDFCSKGFRIPGTNHPFLQPFQKLPDPLPFQR